MPCSRGLLRFDIDKYKDPEGLSWTRQFSIYDESDAQTLVNRNRHPGAGLDPKALLSPEGRWAISKQEPGLLPDVMEAKAEGCVAARRRA